MERLLQRIEDPLLERIIEGLLRRTEGHSLKEMMEVLSQGVDDLLRSSIMGEPQEEGRAVTGDQRGDRSAIHYTENEDCYTVLEAVLRGYLVGILDC